MISLNKVLKVLRIHDTGEIILIIRIIVAITVQEAAAKRFDDALQVRHNDYVSEKV